MAWVGRELFNAFSAWWSQVCQELAALSKTLLGLSSWQAILHASF